MFKYLTKLFKKTPSKPLFKLGDRIRLREAQTASKCYINDDVVIKSDMLLLYKGEKQNRYFFVVRTNFLPSKLDIAKDKDLIYFDKSDFKKVKFRFDNI
jgi:hypothetical protein